ncbi:MAG: PLP-dependent transferase [Idiomarina sp.]|nr:PLP-dependent transferase [Idiomarina sp.]
MTTAKRSKYSSDTKAAQALGAVDDATGGVVPAIHPATTYYRDADNQYRSGRVYGRADNPTYLPAEALLADLEEGEEALLFASGMAAAVAVFQALRPGDHVLAPKVMYWALRQWLLQFATEWGLEVELVDMSSLQDVERQLRPGQTKLIWIESPANPLWGVTDIAGIAALAKPFNVIVAVDSTVATPILCQPLTLGADIVMHSATKYLNGHSDVMAGALVTRKKDEFWARVRNVRKQSGAVLSPFDASQLLRGMRTLALRVRYSSASALQLAEALKDHTEVSQVLYPGLSSAPDHALASEQMKGGFGGMLSLRFRRGAGFAIAVAAHTKLWKRATSLGAVESLIEHRASIEGPDTPVPDDLLRLSVGIESTHDLLEDLYAAIDQAKQSQ